MESDEGVSAETLKAIASAFDVDFRELLSAEIRSPESPDPVADTDELVRKRLDIRRQADELRSKLGDYWESIVHGCILAKCNISAMFLKNSPPLAHKSPCESTC